MIRHLGIVAIVLSAASTAQAQNNKPLRSGAWYEDRASNSSTGYNGITLSFAPTPTDTFLNITNVACSIEVSSGQVIRSAALQIGTRSGENDLGRTYEVLGPASPQSDQIRKFYSVVTNGIHFKIGSGRYPSLFVTGSVTNNQYFNVSCTIVGNLTSN